MARPKRIEYEAFFPSAARSDALPGAKRVPVDRIDPNPEQPRTGPLAGIEDLAASIAEFGLLQPIVIAPAAGGRHTCIAGHRRLAAFRWLVEHHPEPPRWAEIPAVERDGSADDWLALALLENMSRADLTEPEIITGVGLLHDLRGWNQSQIATKLGVSRQRISQYFRVAGDAEVAELVQTGRVTVAKAYDVLLASSPESRGAALAVARQGAPQRIIRQVAKGRPSDAPASSSAANGCAAAGATDAESVPAGADERNGQPTRTGDTAAGGGSHDARRAGAAPPAAGPVATAAPEAGSRDLADVAGVLGVVVRPETLQLTRLLLSASSAGGGIDAQAFLRLARADIRQVEAAIRAALSGVR